MDAIIKYGLENNMVFLALFAVATSGLIWLVRWILKTNDDREIRYITTIETLSQNFELVKDVQETVKRIERKVEGL